MIIIDENGRLFKRVNIIDFLIVVFIVLFFLPTIYYAGKLYMKTRQINKAAVAENQDEQFQKLELNLIINKIKPESVKLFSVGDKEIGEKGEVIGEIVSMDAPEPVTYKVQLNNMKKLISEDPILKRIPVVMKLKVQVKPPYLFYNNRPITENDPIYFNTKKYQAEVLLLPQRETVEEVKSINVSKEEVAVLSRAVNSINQDLFVLKSEVAKIVSSMQNISTRPEDSRINHFMKSNEGIISRLDRLEDKINLILTSPKIKKLLRGQR